MMNVMTTHWSLDATTTNCNTFIFHGLLPESHMEWVYEGLSWLWSWEVCWFYLICWQMMYCIMMWTSWHGMTACVHRNRGSDVVFVRGNFIGNINKWWWWWWWWHNVCIHICYRSFVFLCRVLSSCCQCSGLSGGRMSSVLDELSSATTSSRRQSELCSSSPSDWTDRRSVQPFGSSSCSYAAANWLTTRLSTSCLMERAP